MSGFDHLHASMDAVRGTAKGKLAFAEVLLEHAQDNLRTFRAVVGKKSGQMVLRRFREVVVRLVDAELQTLDLADDERAQVALLHRRRLRRDRDELARSTRAQPPEERGRHVRTPDARRPVGSLTRRLLDADALASRGQAGAATRLGERSLAAACELRSATWGVGFGSPAN